MQPPVPVLGLNQGRQTSEAIQDKVRQTFSFLSVGLLLNLTFRFATLLHRLHKLRYAEDQINLDLTKSKAIDSIKKVWNLSAHLHQFVRKQQIEIYIIYIINLHQSGYLFIIEQKRGAKFTELPSLRGGTIPSE
jgi:hypothetical protein